MSATKPFILTVGVGLLSIAIAAGASAQEPTITDPPKGALDELEKSVVSAIEKGLQLISVAIGTVLPYKLPEVLPNGDIIIRYSPPPPVPEVPAEEPQKT